MIDPEYEKIVELMLGGVEPVRRTGITAVDCRDNYVKLLMPLKGNTNHVGIMYAGPLFVLGEVAGGAVFAVAVDCNRYFPIVKEVNIKFRRPAMSDIYMEVEMSSERAREIEEKVEREGKADFLMELELKDINDDTVASVRGTWQARKIPPGMKMPWSK